MATDFFELSCIRRLSIGGASVEMTQQPCRVPHHPGCHRQITAHCNVCSAQQIKTQSASNTSTDCIALSGALFEPLLFTGEVRGVAAVSGAHASWLTATSACSESP